MFTPEAIETLQKADAIGDAALEFMRAMSSKTPAIALPNSMTLHNIEPYLPTRHRARGVMKTSSMAGFVGYCLAHKETGATLFIEPESIKARAVLNLGTPTAPGHADNIAVFEPDQTAAYKALLVKTREGIVLTQRMLAEFLEDWPQHITCLHAAETLNPAHAIAAVRSLTLEGIKRLQAEEQQLSAARTTFESVTAKGATGNLPTHIHFKCAPYLDLPERTFTLRVSVRTGDKDPAFRLDIAKAEEHRQQMAEQLVALLSRSALAESMHSQIGTYTPGH